ncbi:Lrp/AsnC ligand binding domain-containing protein [candidate division TA06 bacterium]|nr:Lrp/AsnC ligand binding domain-containing protein [candidate division TA06 bacterium]
MAKKERMSAYILINIQAGKTVEAVRNIRRKKGVKEVHIVTGLHDAIALVEGKNLKALTDLIVKGIHKSPGVEKTITCVCVDS